MQFIIFSSLLLFYIEKHRTKCLNNSKQQPKPENGKNAQIVEEQSSESTVAEVVKQVCNARNVVADVQESQSALLSAEACNIPAFGKQCAQ